MQQAVRSLSRAGWNVLLGTILLSVWLLSAPQVVHAADTFFSSSAAFKEELNRLGGEAALMVKAPVDPYLLETTAVAGMFALSYLYDQDIRSDLQANRSRTLTRATDVGSLMGDPYIHLGAAALVYGVGALSERPKMQELGAKLGEALVLADVSTFVLKQGIGRARPGNGAGSGSFRPFQFKNDYDSLPSLHTASSFAVAHVLASESKSLPVKILYYAGASFVGFSRMYKDKHWASDVVLAAALGELAGNSVTRFRNAKPGTMTLAPAVSGGTPMLALQGKF
ncbi:phosphatase PAP2 family protein [Geomonas limicola]|uniref:Phosphatase PAP2 family protein n=1 Tax=Geomonas limicola TaxID=2740186 RepID=A0A6V8ND61_9BACT|nr:phosphatase PAP2 family protein [Geomonas limicola]